MTEQSKPEINLEICTGFFRIPTESAVYNITVLDSPQSPVTPVVQKIVESEKTGQPLNMPSEYAETPPGPLQSDDFYRAVSEDVFKDIGHLAKSLSNTIMEIPAEDRQGKRAELDEAGEKIEEAKSQLKDIVAMTEKATMDIMDYVENVQDQTNDVKDILLVLKEHQAFKTVIPGEGEAEEKQELKSTDSELAGIKEMLSRAKDLSGSIMKDAVSSQKPEKKEEQAREKSTRYLFDLDAVFQTIYELCTNETVKKHISTARQNAPEIFNRDAFIDAISPAVHGLPREDGFVSPPLSVVLKSLFDACQDNKIMNLLKKMEAEKEAIFLDQTLPLELPSIEEIQPAGGVTEDLLDLGDLQEEDPRLAELDGLLSQTEAALDAYAAGRGDAASNADISVMTIEDQNEIFKKIETAFDEVASICGVVSRITETLSFQDLAGQQIMKIIKLLSDFQLQLLAIVVTFGSQLKQKEKIPNITIEESKKLAQGDVDAYFNKFRQKDEDEEAEVLDQDAVNQMLEDFGF